MLYPVLLVAGGFRRRCGRLPAVLAFLFGSALPIYFLNKVLYTNFYFLNGPTSSPVTALFTQWFGEQWYLLGFLPGRGAGADGDVSAVVYSSKKIEATKKNRHPAR